MMMAERRVRPLRFHHSAPRLDSTRPLTCDQIEGCHELEEDAGQYHGERNHQGKGNVILFPSAEDRIGGREGAVECRAMPHC
jgi:hypothetical protein